MGVESKRRSVGSTLPRFVVVGAGGVAVNQLLLAGLHLGLNVPLLLASAVATETAIVHNYLWHEHWTFDRGRTRFRDFLRFNGVALVALVLTVVTLALLVHHTSMPPLVANPVAIGAGTVCNYAASRQWVWAPRIRTSYGDYGAANVRR